MRPPSPPLVVTRVGYQITINGQFTLAKPPRQGQWVIKTLVGESPISEDWLRFDPAYYPGMGMALFEFNTAERAETVVAGLVGKGIARELDDTPGGPAPEKTEPETECGQCWLHRTQRMGRPCNPKCKPS